MTAPVSKRSGLDFARLTAAALACAVSTLPAFAAETRGAPSADKIARGKYLVTITGCNDCHTPGYAQSGGTMSTSDWLTGLPVGFRGAWGTSYPANLRLTIVGMSEDQWLQFARAPRLPPMPWFNLKAMNDDDLLHLLCLLGINMVGLENGSQGR